MKQELEKILKKEAGDRSGLIYGMGHAIYTKSDPRTVLLKKNAKTLAEQKGMLKEFSLIESVERLAPPFFTDKNGSERAICANVDMYSGFVYQMLNIPTELYTPLFAISRVAGWSAHIIEEFMLGKKIIRPAYKSISHHKEYVPLESR
ncbi:2-methylcitrate synthase [bioreactor metagenome]|uniref:2-methylcitrate synthase n=1 Tax=bioreactor metagenome TaxID=1076179 RepID=A0A645G2B4_9ZZZZ